MTTTLRPIAVTIVAAVLAACALMSVPVDHARASANEFLTLINQYRASHGAPPLVRIPALDTIAQNWTARMVSTDRLAHNPDYQKQYPKDWQLAGENVGYSGSVQSLHQALVESPGHRANLLDSRYNAVGLGFVKGPDGRMWVTQNFARYANPTAYVTINAQDRRMVRGVYLDMLGREPDRGGWDNWSRQVAAYGRTSVATGFGNSSEYRRLTITTAYTQVLRRTPGDSEVTFWEQQTARGATDLDRIPRDFYASDEFFAQAGGTNEAFIRRMYQVALGRSSVGQSEIQHWNSRLAQQGRGTVITGIYGSHESALSRVDRSYHRWLKRGAGANERAHWAGTIQRVGEEGLRVQLVISQEYYLRAQTR